MAKEVFDILIDSDFDLLFENDDLVIGESTNQHTEHIVIAAKGDYKLHPLTGFNIIRFLNAPSSSKNKFERELDLQLIADGQVVNDIDVVGSFENVAIDSEYE